jgi:hypothetical protein
MADESARTIKEQVAWELRLRPRIGLLALASGVLYLASQVVQTVAFRNAPTVSLVQGITPALRGVANPQVSPKVAEIRFLSHHAAVLVVGSVVAAASLVLIAVVLGFLADAARFRRPDGPRPARPLAVYGALGFAVLSIAHQVIAAISTHKFVTGHDFTNHAADQAIRTGTALTVDTYLNLPVALAFGAGVVMVSMNIMRTGLVTRFMGILGCIVGVLYILPLSQSLSILTVFWLIALGTLLMGRWPSGDPPAWEAGEARPWPSQAEQREARGDAPRDSTRRGGRGASAKPATAKAAAGRSDAAAQAPPEPAAPVHSSSRKRKRKGRARR